MPNLFGHIYIQYFQKSMLSFLKSENTDNLMLIIFNNCVLVPLIYELYNYCDSIFIIMNSHCLAIVIVLIFIIAQL